MGECGCGEFQPYESFKIGDSILSLEIYKGCEYCNTGLMVTLNAFTPEEAENWQLEDVKEIDPKEKGWLQHDFPLLGKEDLLAALEEIQKEIDVSEYGSFEDFLKDYGLELIQKGVRNRLKIIEANKASDDN